MGIVTVTNLGSTACLLGGAPGAVRVRIVGGVKVPTVYSADARPDPGSNPGVVAPAVTLAPGHKATSAFVWRNQCQARTKNLLIVVRIRGDSASISFPGPGRFGLPRCDLASESAAIVAFAWTAGTT
jgi:hypothetical protein